MARRATSARRNDGPTGATLGFEATLWQAEGKLPSNMDAAAYKHVVLGLTFLKYISDPFEDEHAKLEAQRPQGADLEAGGDRALGRDPRSTPWVEDAAGR